MIPLQDTVRSRSFPIINWLLISSNVLIFFVIVSFGARAEDIVEIFGLIPVRFLWQTDMFEIMILITSMFIHAGWAHLFSNMIALYIFGDNVEDKMGSIRYLIFYILCGILAALIHVVFNPNSNLPTVGASGAISGVLAAYLIFFPNARVITLIPIIFIPWFVEIPAVIYLGFWFLSQLLNGIMAIFVNVQAFGGIAWWAHIGGFVGGLVLAKPFSYRKYVRRIYLDEYFPW